MTEFKETKTFENLKAAFAGESQANRRYLWFAKVAEEAGQSEIAKEFQKIAKHETAHAHRHLEFLKQVGDPATGLAIGDTNANLKAAIAGETHEFENMYPDMAKTAKEEGFDEIARWFEQVGKAENAHAKKYRELLDSIS
ncbi:MAG: rubrerythrin family protein [Candidatus Heimdallarchaeota archaeon]